MTEAPRRPPAQPVERVRDEHPPAGEWRADALAGSRHTRLLDELRLPQAETDPERAAALCAEVCRNALRDLAPALILLPAAERRRVQALAAYALTLWDFARQSGLEGERLSQINRWQYGLEEALEGEPAGQPVFLRMAAEHEQRPWPQEALDRLAGAARHRVTCRRPTNAEARAAEARELGAALSEAALGEPAPEAAVDLAEALVRLFGLLDLGEGLRRHAARLPLDELADDWEPGGDRSAEALAAAVERECGRIERILTRGRKAPAALPVAWRRAARFTGHCGARLLELVRGAGPALASAPPRLGIGARLGLLLRARLG